MGQRKRRFRSALVLPEKLLQGVKQQLNMRQRKGGAIGGTPQPAKRKVRFLRTGGGVMSETGMTGKGKSGKQRTEKKFHTSTNLWGGN